MSACGSRNVTPVPDASIGYAFGSPQSSWVTFDATRGIFALAIAGGHVGLAGGALVVDRRDDARVVDRPHARDGLVDVGRRRRRW